MSIVMDLLCLFLSTGLIMGTIIVLVFGFQILGIMHNSFEQTKEKEEKQ